MSIFFTKLDIFVFDVQFSLPIAHAIAQSRPAGGQVLATLPDVKISDCTYYKPQLHRVAQSKKIKAD